MKQSRNRGRGANSRRRSNTPAVICLPHTKPSVTPPRKEPEALRAFALPKTREPLAKGAALTPGTGVASSAPLPRNRALVLQPKGLMVVVSQWLRKLVMKPKAAALTIDTASARTQVRALRVEVAQLQRSIDQLMAQLKQAQ